MSHEEPAARRLPGATSAFLTAATHHPPHLAQQPQPPPQVSLIPSFFIVSLSFFLLPTHGQVLAKYFGLLEAAARERLVEAECELVEFAMPAQPVQLAA